MRFLRGFKGYRRLDKIKNNQIRELQISGIVSEININKIGLPTSKGWEAQNSQNIALNYKPKRKRDRGRPRERWQNNVLAETGLTLDCK